jgi:hypothetical protein
MKVLKQNMLEIESFDPKKFNFSHNLKEMLLLNEKPE